LLESQPADQPMEIMMEAADYIRALKEATALQPTP
jgi:hypothetical protein